VTLKKVQDINSAKEFISSISDLNKTASHNCWAYIVGDKGETVHSSDAGEPSGTAGKPILNTLQKYDLSNVAAVVTRYYGGVKLGVRGLIDAYGSTVEKAIQKAALNKIVNYKKYKLQTSYDFLDILNYNLKKLNSEVISIDYTDVVSVIVQVEEIGFEHLEKYLMEMSNSGKLTIL
ncbi:MAG: hypothetical protein APR54_03340, partial [Candidatus Cloacimonas sp. SDB]